MSEVLLENEPYLCRKGRGTVFGDRVINVNQISKAQGLCQSHLSRAFRGERDLTLKEVRAISAYLGMPIEEFLETFEKRLQSIRTNQEQVLTEYTERVDGEDRNNLARIEQGEVAIPSIPGLRA